MQRRVWAYLEKSDQELFHKKAQDLGMTDGELDKKLILMFLHTSPNGVENECLKCQYYHIASSAVIQAFMKLNEALTLVTPEYKRKK